MGRNCRSNIRCSTCNGRHHVSICQSSHKDTKSSDPTAPNTGKFCPPVLLQTAKVRVSQPGRPDLSLETRVIFDCGSQRSYVTDQLKNSLDLPTRSVDTLMIRTFGSSEEQVQTFEVVDLLMETGGSESLQLSFLVVPAAIETVFGWVLSGPVDSAPEPTTLAPTHKLRIESYPGMITSTPGCTGSVTWRPLPLKIVNHLFMTSL